MPLPPEVDQRIRHRFDSLVNEAESLVVEMKNEQALQKSRARSAGIDVWGEIDVLEDKFFSLRTRSLSLLNMLSMGGGHVAKLYDEVSSLSSKISEIEKLHGILRGLQDDYESGMLEHLGRLIEVNIVADYFQQAERLLQEGHPGQHDHVPAAVLAGAVLEDALRRLCQRQTPPISTTKSNGELKTLNPLIDDLKQANVYSELKAKQLRAWADIRNAAAHGQFDDFTRSDVEQMLAGIQNFLADYL